MIKYNYCLGGSAHSGGPEGPIVVQAHKSGSGWPSLWRGFKGMRAR